jgi:hypothetical protein
MNNLNSVMASYENHVRAQAKLNEGNKVEIFDALASANITLVVVDFDGEGDSGQIESVIAFNGEEPTELPATTVTIRQVQYGKSEPFPTECSIKEAIETLCYDYLEEKHGGWENNDGAFGEFRIDVAKRTIELECNARFSTYDTYTHTF